MRERKQVMGALRWKPAQCVGIRIKRLRRETRRMEFFLNEMGEDAAGFAAGATSRVGFVCVICEAAIRYVYLKFNAWGTNLASVLKFSPSRPLALQRKAPQNFIE